MPTVGWIRESDLDAFYESTEYTPDPSLPEPIFVCPFCAMVFSTQSEFHDHVYTEHRVERPLIMFKGKEPAAHDIIRSTFDQSDITLANISFARMCVDGENSQCVSPNELKVLMANMAQAEVKLELVNSTEKNATPVTSHYNLSFRIAKQQALKNVEKAYAEILVSKEITRGVIDNFLSDERTQNSGKEYASGLGRYCLGILLKERPEDENLTTPLSRYRELYGNALEILKDFQRPLALLITNIIRFSMNDFVSGNQRTGYWELDLATRLLQDPNSESMPENFKDAERCPICPIDHGTGRLLELASRLAEQSRWSPILDDECRGLAHSELLDASDHEKAFAIWAASAWRLDSRQNAIEPLTQIAEVYPFSLWAREYLEQVTT